MPSLTAIILTPKTQLPYTNENSCLLLRKRRFKKRSIFVLILHLFINFSLVELTYFRDCVFRLNFSTRLMVHEGYFIIYKISFSSSRNRLTSHDIYHSKLQWPGIFQFYNQKIVADKNARKFRLRERPYSC